MLITQLALNAASGTSLKQITAQKIKVVGSSTVFLKRSVKALPMKTSTSATGILGARSAVSGPYKERELKKR